MMLLDDALKIVLATVKPTGVEETALAEAHGRTLAEDVVAGDDIPCYDNSGMDGYAVIADDLASASKETPVALQLCEDVPAGKLPQKQVTRGQATRIMTGAPIPKGANAVVMVEVTETLGGKVTFFQSVKEQDNIRLAGEDVKKGEVVLKTGDAVRPQEMGLLASIGRSRVRVFRRPQVAILSTGDEVIECDQPLTTGKVRNSNAYTLTGLVLKYGGLPVRLGIAPDTKAALRERLVAGLQFDMIVTTGGVSVGDYDFVKEVLKDLHWDLKFWEVASKPGKPVAFGLLNSVFAPGKAGMPALRQSGIAGLWGKNIGKPIFGLPGNPSGTAVAFEQLVRPALLKMQGRRQFTKLAIGARLETDLKKKPGRTEFVPALVTRRDGEFYASRCGAHGSGVLKPLCLANAFIVFPSETASLKKGDVVEAQLFDGPELE